MLDIKYELEKNPKQKPAENDPLTFGTIFTDHMFMMNYEKGKGWFDARIVPYQEISLAPSAMVFHYGQEMFEGLKAYKSVDGRNLMFRPQKNIERANKTNDRICIPRLDPDDFLTALKALIKLEEDWIPKKEGTSLYVRPFIIATDPFLGVRPSHTYLFMIILSPSGLYYPEGLNPVKIWVEDECVRTVKGGIGEAKVGGNYVASILSQVKAHDLGYTQVLWLDGIERKYIEEVGSMNIFFKINNTIITPVLSGSILPGVTRDSAITLCKDWGYTVEERKISIDEVYEAHQAGTLEEIWGTGTAAIISPVGELKWEERVMKVKDGKTGELSQRLYDEVTGMQLGRIQDTRDWIVEVK